MAPQTRLLHVLKSLQEVARQAQHAIVCGDVGALPGLVEKECALAGELSRVLSQLPPGWDSGVEPGHGSAAELRAHALAWRRLHEQNRLLLEHAHRTVVELIAVLTGATVEGPGLYGPADVAGESQPPGELQVAAVDRRA